jgi:hypothetical protein
MLHFPDRPARSASTAIYFLLDAESFSALHRVSSDEVWHHYDGAPVDLHLIAQDGEHLVLCLGKDLDGGQRPQHVVPAGVWQAAVPRGDALCGCTVAPGFDFDDFEMPRGRGRGPQVRTSRAGDRARRCAAWSPSWRWRYL